MYHVLLVNKIVTVNFVHSFWHIHI